MTQAGVEQDSMRLIDAMACTEAPSASRHPDVETDPTPNDIRKVEELFRENIEFESSDLFGMPNGRMESCVLKAVLARLVVQKKVLINDDKTLTWIYAKDDEVLKRRWEEAVPL